MLVLPFLKEQNMQNSQLSAGLRARVALEKHIFKPAHSLGQNFILDDGFLSLLLDLAEVNREDRVLEIGPGPGVMTSLLADRAQKVLAIEMDEKLKPVLEDVLSGQDNAKVLFMDAMRADLATLVREELGGEGYRVVANLPYYITADLIQKMVLTRPRPESVCVMVQKEAAERLMSEPGAKNWCAFAAMVRCYGECEILDEVPPQRFNPAPHVDSCFIRIHLHDQDLVEPELEEELLKMVRCCFHMRRKTLANNLKACYGINQEQAVRVIEEAGLKPQVRGEALTLEEIARLTKVMAG